MPAQKLPTGDLGPCRISFKGVDLGSTSGGVIVRYTEETTPVMTDQTGNTHVDDINLGSTVEVEANLTRTAAATLAGIFPGASGSGTSGDTILFRNAVGSSRRDDAGKLVVKRVTKNGQASTDEKDWITFFEAAPHSEMEWTYDAETQRVVKVMFKVYPVENSNELFRIGPKI